MSVLNIAIVDALPGTPAGNTVYFITDGAGGLTITVTNPDGTTARSTKTTAQIQSLIDTAIGGSAGAIPIYTATIATRDALTLTKNTFVFVADASADATVDAGAALYFYAYGEGSPWKKVYEYEGMDFTIPNVTILSDLSDIGAKLGYKGALVSNVNFAGTSWT